jgi:cell division protein FtsB
MFAVKNSHSLPMDDANELEAKLDTDAPVDPSAAPVRSRGRRRVAGIEARERRQTRIRYALLFISAAFMINALVGDNGLLATIKAQREYAAVERQVNALREENQRLLLNVHRLKDDPSAIEEEARRDLGLIRPGETLVIIKNAPPPK